MGRVDALHVRGHVEHPVPERHVHDLFHHGPGRVQHRVGHPGVLRHHRGREEQERMSIAIQLFSCKATRKWNLRLPTLPGEMRTREGCECGYTSPRVVGANKITARVWPK